MDQIVTPRPGSTLDALKAARSLITPLEKWTTNAYARTRPGGAAVASVDPRATCWCAIGALSKVCETGDGLGDGYEKTLSFKAREALEVACRNIFGKNEPVDVNDQMGHDAVLKAYDAAVAAEEAKSEIVAPF